MKRLVLLITVLLLACAGNDAAAQGFLKKIGKAIKEKTVDKTEETVDEAVDKAFDALGGLLSGKKKSTDDEDEDDEDEEDTEGKNNLVSPTWNCPNPDCGHTGNTGKFCSECGTSRPANLVSAFNNGRYSSKKITFAPGSTELKFESVNEIQKIAEYLKNNPDSRFIVQVICFGAETDEENALGEDRAKSVIKALSDMGCDEFNFKPAGKDYDFGENAKPFGANLKGLYTIFTRK